MKIKPLVANLSLTAVSLLIVLAAAEVASRFMVPISPGPSLLSMEGIPLKQSYLKPGSEYRIITPDFDAHTTITSDGYRAPAAEGTPDTLFVGDSFTFAQGVTDEQAFPHLYCKATNKNCANLAVPGASTIYSVSRLERYLRVNGWTPNEVNFFFFTGNDFSDNLWAAEQQRKGRNYEPLELNPEQEEARRKQLPLHKKGIDFALRKSNLVRVLYYKVLAELRKSTDTEGAQAEMDKALVITKQALNRLDQLSETFAFNYRIFVIYPETQARLGQYKTMDKLIQSIAPNQIISLGPLFAEQSEQFYFESDGHFSVAGNKHLAEYLVKTLP